MNKVLTFCIVFFQCQLHYYLGWYSELQEPTGIVYPQKQNPRPERGLLATRSNQVEKFVARGKSMLQHNPEWFVSLPSQNSFSCKMHLILNSKVIEKEMYFWNMPGFESI